ncbi:MAG: TlyA family RNA methyltransferase [Ruminococcaceae bacterium]|nr:TlyA family RNA methyltransferase [Oscillospiraceae bacterium]
MRLDLYLTERGLADSRSRAKRLIESGAVLVDGVPADKAGFEIKGEPTVTVKEERFVGRGGEKLSAALSCFSIDPTGLRALDIGASTGGFTDCLLQNGAAAVVAVDAGCGQLHPRLVADPRVTNLEKYNARELSVQDVGTVSLVVMDVSFISQTYILPRIPAVLAPGGRVVTLIKPQFEAGREALNKNGIVKAPRDRVRAVRRVLQAAGDCGLCCRGLAPSPILGGDGNVEFLAYFEQGASAELNVAVPVEKTVLEGVIYR